MDVHDQHTSTSEAAGPKTGSATSGSATPSALHLALPEIVRRFGPIDPTELDERYMGTFASKAEFARVLGNVDGSGEWSGSYEAGVTEVVLSEALDDFEYFVTSLGTVVVHRS